MLGNAKAIAIVEEIQEIISDAKSATNAIGRATLPGIVRKKTRDVIGAMVSIIY